MTPETAEQPSFLLALAVFLLLGYLLGSIPWGLLIGFANNVDIRTKGSHNIGSTNVTRILGGGWGKVCFVLDFSKGLLAVLLAVWSAQWIGFSSPGLAKILGGAGAILGHCYPVWLKFKGGKGVASGAGVALGLAFWPCIIGLVVWCACELKTHIVAIASLAAAITVAVMAFVFQVFGLEKIGWPVVLLLAAIAAVIVYRHKDNIKRLREGRENSFRK